MFLPVACEITIRQALCALGVRYKFGTTEGEKEWLSGSYATPNEALGFFDSVVGIQEVNFGFRPSHCSGAGLSPIGRSKIPEKR